MNSPVEIVELKGRKLDFENASGQPMLGANINVLVLVCEINT